MKLFSAVDVIIKLLRVGERSSDSYIGRDNFFQEKS